jgi:hypothetical protein
MGGIGMRSRLIFLIAAISIAGPSFGQSNSLTPTWKRNADGSPFESAPKYTGKYCNYAEFDGLEFSFSRDPVYATYGFQMFKVGDHGLVTLPFADFAGKKGKIGRATTSGMREVLIEDCTAAQLMKSGIIDAGDAVGLGVAFLSPPSTDWAVSEEVDRLTDARSCHVIPRGADMPFPMFFYHSSEGFSANAVGGDFPGKPVSFRVDKLKVISEREGLSGSNAQTLATQIRSGGQQLLVGAYEWPHEVEVIREFNLEGLAPLLDRCRAYVRAR